MGKQPFFNYELRITLKYGETTMLLFTAPVKIIRNP